MTSLILNGARKPDRRVTSPLSAASLSNQLTMSSSNFAIAYEELISAPCYIPL